MIRFLDWEKRFAAYLKANRSTPFAWGTFDCALFACAAAESFTGVDLASEMRGRYSTAEEAEALMRAAVGIEGPFVGGPSSLEQYAEMVAARNGLEEVSIKFARRGDIVLWNSPACDALGIVGLDGAKALFATEKGPLAVRVLGCDRAWKIG